MHADHEPARGSGLSTAGHAGWFRDRLSGARSLDVGAGERASRSWRSVKGRRTRRLIEATLVLVSGACAAAGVVLAVAPVEVSVSMTADTYRVGDAVLHKVAPDVYSGNGTLVVMQRKQGVHAGASAVVGGALWGGACDVARGGEHETCLLREGRTMLTAQDTWTRGAWQRAYSDGLRVSISADQGVPVPFPVGR